MYVIALTLLVVCQAQLEPKYAPFELESGDKTYYITYLDGRFFDGEKVGIYVRRTSADWHLATDTVRYYLDDFDKSSKSPVTFAISEIREDGECDYKDQSRRERRLALQLEKWHEANGNVKVDLANGSMGWVTQEKADWSRRARQAAITVIDDRVELESVKKITSAVAPVETDEEPPAGFVELWGPQAAAGVLGLVLMGVAARLLIFSGVRTNND